MFFTGNVAKIMTAKNISYEDLQFAADITPETVARARDKRIAGCSLKTLGKIAEALQVDVKALFDSFSEKGRESAGEKPPRGKK